MSVHRLRRLGEQQLGLVTTRQVHAELTDHEARVHRERGWLVRVRPRVLRFAGSTRSWEQSVMAVVLAAGDDAVASHHTAAAIHDLAGFRRGTTTPLHVTVPRGRHPRLKGVVVHTPRIPAVTGRQGALPVTSPAQTLHDLDGVLPASRLARCLDDALMRGTVALEQLVAVAQARSGRRGHLPGLLDQRVGSWDHAGSAGEVQILEWLLDAGLPPPVQQHPVSRYRIDLAYPDERVLIEYDGFATHATRTRFDGDRRRSNELQVRDGAIVLRYTSTSTRDVVVREVTAASALAAVRARSTG